MVQALEPRLWAETRESLGSLKQRMELETRLYARSS